MGRVARGWALTKSSWKVLSADRELMLLPLMSAVTMMAAGIAGFLLLNAGGALDEGARAGADGGPGAGGIAGMIVLYFVATTIAIFFNAAVIGAARIRLDGGDPTVRDGLRIARSKLGKIVAWAAISTTVGLLLRALEQRAGIFGRIVVWIVGAAWGAVTFFVVPVILFEPLESTGAIKRSAQLFKQRWGEQFVGEASIGGITVLIALPLVIVTFALANLAAPLAVLFGVVAFGLLFAASSAMSGIFNAALYSYAVTGQSPNPEYFSVDDLRGTFRERRKRRFW